MKKPQETMALADLSQGWAQESLPSLLSHSALMLGAATATDVGRSWTLPTLHPDPIFLAAGVPDVATLPVAELRQALDQVLASSPEEALEYGGIVGFEGLRSALAQRQSRLEGIPLEADQFILSNGSAGAIANICAAFLDSGDVAIVEAPSFSGSLRAIRGHGAKLVEVPMEEDGVSVEGVADAIKQSQAAGERVKLLYIIADFHNPTGMSMTTERRSALISLCAKHRILVVEDAAYAELCFEASTPPSLYALAQGQGVLKVGTLSKTIATGLRVGWVQGLSVFTAALGRVRFDMGNSPLLHRALADYVGSGRLDAHVQRMREVYAEKCGALCHSLVEHCGPYVSFQRPKGGFFLWVECLGARAKDVAREAAIEGLTFPVGATFFGVDNAANTTHLRLAFSNATLEQLAEVGPRLRAAFLRVVE